MKTTNQTRRDVMQVAWGLFRSDANSANPRSFADALTGAWRWVKNLAKLAVPAWAKGGQVRHIRLRSMVTSPIARSLTGQAYAGLNAASAGYVTSRFGA
jgi:anti-sigma factor ChrR (cupin superfamily)